MIVPTFLPKFPTEMGKRSCAKRCWQPITTPTTSGRSCWPDVCWGPGRLRLESAEHSQESSIESSRVCSVVPHLYIERAMRFLCPTGGRPKEEGGRAVHGRRPAI